MFEDSIRVILVSRSWVVNTLLITYSKVFLTINYWRFLISREYLIFWHQIIRNAIYFKIPNSLHLSAKIETRF